MQRCPCCNAKLNQSVSCPRCKADLEKILQGQQAATFYYQKAIDYYLSNELQASIDALTQSLQLDYKKSASVFQTFVIDQQKTQKDLSTRKPFWSTKNAWFTLK